MELREVARIVRKRWILAAVGLLAAIVFAYLTYENSPPSPYTSTATLFVTQQGFPFASPIQAGSGVNPTQLSTLAFSYAQIAQGDAIRRTVGAPPESISASVKSTGDFGTGTALPFIVLTTSAPTASRAQSLALAATRALRNYVYRGEQASKTPIPERVNLKVVNAPTAGERVAARRRVVILPGVVFVTVLLVALGAMFMLENLSQPQHAAPRLQPANGSAAHSRWPGAMTEEPRRAESSAAPSRFLRRE